MVWQEKNIGTAHKHHKQPWISDTLAGRPGFLEYLNVANARGIIAKQLFLNTVTVVIDIAVGNDHGGPVCCLGRSGITRFRI